MVFGSRTTGYYLRRFAWTKIVRHQLVTGTASSEGLRRSNAPELPDEHVGHGSAYRLEWLLGGAKWDADALRDRVRDYVVATLGAEDGVLIADDTQVIKKGDKSVGVAPQHCGATGQTENCQVLPMLAYASGRGHAFIDRALYLPRRWTDDPQRCAQAGVPAERG